MLTWDCPKKHRWMDYDGLILSYGPNSLLPWGSLLFDHIWSIAIAFGTPTHRAIFRLGHGAVNPWMVFVESVSWKPLLHPFAHGWNVADICWHLLTMTGWWFSLSWVLYNYFGIFLDYHPKSREKAKVCEKSPTKYHEDQRLLGIHPLTIGHELQAQEIGSQLAWQSAASRPMGRIMICDVRWVRYFTSSS